MTQPGKPMQCDKTMDVILLLDGSGSLGKTGWNAEIHAAKMIVDAFKVNAEDESKANLAILLYSGPSTWGGVYRCTGPSTAKVDVEKTCKIKVVQHFSRNMKKVETLITSLDFPQGSTLTSMALMTAISEINTGRNDAKATVIVITDGRPLSPRKTWKAAREVRKIARLVWIPVTGNAPLKLIKRMATRLWRENVVLAHSFEELESPQLITHLIADICPDDKRGDRKSVV